MYLALIENDLVKNVIIGSTENFPQGIDVTNMSPRPAPGWSYVDGVFAPPAPTEETAERHITRLAFRQRFTQAELVAIEMACLDDPTASMANRQTAASIRVMQRQVAEASYIDLNRTDTRAGVQQLEMVGLLGTGRALEILDAEIQDIERPK